MSDLARRDCEFVNGYLSASDELYVGGFEIGDGDGDSLLAYIEWRAVTEDRGVAGEFFNLAEDCACADIGVNITVEDLDQAIKARVASIVPDAQANDELGEAAARAWTDAWAESVRTTYQRARSEWRLGWSADVRQPSQA